MVKNITAEQLADKIDSDEQFTLVDVRPEDSYEAWHVRDAENVPYDPDEGLSGDQLNEVNALVDGQPVVAICGKGLTSTPFAFDLDEYGYDDVDRYRPVIGLDILNGNPQLPRSGSGSPGRRNLATEYVSSGSTASPSICISTRRRPRLAVGSTFTTTFEEKFRTRPSLWSNGYGVKLSSRNSSMWLVSCWP